MNKKNGIVLFCLFFSVSALGSCVRFLPENQLNLGVWASEKDMWDEAVFRWQKAVAAEPNSAAAHNNLAVACEKKGQWDEAEKEYSLALKLAPGNTYIKANYENFKENLADAGKNKEKPDEKAVKDKREKE
jgi:tetratricopeptide (TPR) repeat protein